MDRIQIYIFQKRKKEIIWTNLDIRKEDYVLFEEDGEKYIAVVTKTFKQLNNHYDCKFVLKNDKKIQEKTLKAEDKEEKENKNTKRKMLSLKKLNDKELKKYLENRIKAGNLTKSILKDIDKFKLKINLVDIQFNYENTKLIILYTAEERVDFRNFVKEMAKKYKKRIEMVQISQVEETIKHGGFGRCGRKLCCISFLSKPISVSIKNAKNQDLALNIENISGRCGKLMCCLNYEDDAYTDIRGKLPKNGDKIKTEEGIGEVVDINPLKKILRLKFFDENSDIYFKKVKVEGDGKIKFLK